MDVKQLCPNFSELNYDTFIDSYLPTVAKTTTDQPVYPQDVIDIYELEQEYKKICEKKIEP